MTGHKESSFIGAGGASLYCQTWQPSGTPRAVIALVHGVGEHSGRYSTLVDGVTAAEFAIVAFDNRGHGRSPGRRGHIMSWSEYREDVRAFLRFVRAQFPNLPLFLYGHSLGGLIVTEYVLSHPQGLDGLIVSGVATQPTDVSEPYLVLAARLLTRVMPKFSVRLKVNPGALSRDQTVVSAYGSDPLVHHLASMRWGTEVLAAIARVRSRSGEIRLPVLIIHGASDRVISVEASRELFESASSADKKLIIYPNGLHEPHNDLDRDQVVSDVVTWIEEHLTDDTQRSVTPGTG